MRQIGDMAPRPFKIGGVLFEQSVEFGYQRQNFQRLFAGHSFAPAGPHVGDGLAQSFERTQSEPDLQNDGQHKREPQHGERYRQCHHRLPQRTVNRRARSRHNDGDGGASNHHSLNSEMQCCVPRTNSFGRCRTLLAWRTPEFWNIDAWHPQASASAGRFSAQ